MYDGHHLTTKKEKKSKSSKKLLLHMLARLRKYKYSYGTIITIQIDQKNFGQKKLGAHLQIGVDRMIPIYKCVPPPLNTIIKIFQKKGRVKKIDNLMTEKPVN